MKHNRIISELERRLKENHKDAIIKREEEFCLNCGKPGECDLYLADIVRDYAYVIEVKTHDSRKSRGKGYTQCEKDVKMIKEKYDISRVFKFYAYSKGDGYVVEQYK
jgi:hypothetical protein